MPASQLRVRPPDAGFWELVFRQPVTPLLAELWCRHMPGATRAATRRYGLLFDHYEYALTGGFLYQSPRFPSREERAERARRAAGVISRKIWRADVRHWNRVAKPRIQQRHLELEREVPRSLSTRRLAVHLDACWSDAQDAVFAAESRFPCSLVPLGDFVLKAEDWLPDGATRLIAIIAALREQISDVFLPEFQELRDALRRRPKLLDAITSSSADDPVALFGALCRAGVPAGARAYLRRLSRRVVGFNDISSPCGDEVPHLLIASLRELVASDPVAHDNAALIRDVRADVPARRRDRFDGLLGEVIRTFRHRDERRLYTLPWALGLCRRAVLEAGRRLSDRGLIQEPGHLLDATPEEMQRLLRGDRVVEARELAHRQDQRQRSIQRPPLRFGDSEHGWRGLNPPRVPRDQARVHAAVVACSVLIHGGVVSDELVDLRATPRRAAPRRRDRVIRRLQGIGASPGTYRGTTCVVQRPEDLTRLRKGDILVTFFTEASTYNAVLPLLGGLVTERGGMLSHAAIVAREYGFPAVVGVAGAMDAIGDGLQLLVDGDRGCVELL